MEIIQNESTSFSQKVILPHVQFLSYSVSSHSFTSQFPSLMCPFQVKKDERPHIYKTSDSNRDKLPHLHHSNCIHATNSETQ